MLSIQTILHPTDFSEYSNYAFDLACAFARDHGARLIILHVAMPTLVIYGEGVLPPQPVDYLDRAREQLQQVVPQDPKVTVEHRLVEGAAAPEILRVAEETRCDLIVMGTHGRTGMGRLLMGSVAEQVVRKASCPVLTVKTPLRQEPAAELGDTAGRMEETGGQLTGSRLAGLEQRSEMAQDRPESAGINPAARRPVEATK
jgi:nucleotide-binding universal stress UspA family protein